MMAQSNSLFDSEENSCEGLNYDTETTLCRRLEKMVNNKLLLDVTFIVGPEKRRIYAHKQYLVTASEFFYKMFCGNFIEAQRKEVVLEDVDAELFLTILRLVYSKEVHLNWDNISAIYDIMQRFLLMDYFDPLISFLKNQVVNLDTAIMVFLNNDHFNFKEVDEKCMHYILNNPFYLFKRDEFTSMSQGRLIKILTAWRINCTTAQLEQALDKWLSENKSSNDNELRKLVTEKIRAIYAHKLHLFYGNCPYDNQTTGKLGIRLISRKPLALYGVGIYARAYEKEYIAKLALYDGELKLRECEFKIFPSFGDTIVKVLFEEVVLVQDVTYHMHISNLNMIRYRGAPTLAHEHIKIHFNTIESGFPHIAYLLAKYSDCVTTTEGGSQSCCKCPKIACN
ncbi:BTB/POZ domain-containing protein 6-like isoform X2 [Anopheles arabiensis]|nr:BTB/POZ domain-containing protein 6-like isoform X2 [Anopheles arabiensis]XP_040158703.1 BTB/POZ domain-containing protein 6-like isoform X2 [Anopheles arabiensis]